MIINVEMVVSRWLSASQEVFQYWAISRFSPITYPILPTIIPVAHYALDKTLIINFLSPTTVVRGIYTGSFQLTEGIQTPMFEVKFMGCTRGLVQPWSQLKRLTSTYSTCILSITCLVF